MFVLCVALHENAQKWFWTKVLIPTVCSVTLQITRPRVRNTLSIICSPSDLEKDTELPSVFCFELPSKIHAVFRF